MFDSDYIPEGFLPIPLGVAEAHERNTGRKPSFYCATPKSGNCKLVRQIYCSECRRAPAFCTSNFDNICQGKVPCYCSKAVRYKSMRDAIRCYEHRTGKIFPYTTSQEDWRRARYLTEWYCEICNRPEKYCKSTFDNIISHGNVICYCSLSPDLKSFEDLQLYLKHKGIPEIRYRHIGKWHGAYSNLNCWFCDTCRRPSKYTKGGVGNILSNNGSMCYCSINPKYHGYEDWAMGYEYRHKEKPPVIIGEWRGTGNKALFQFECGHSCHKKPSNIDNGEGCIECVEYGYKPSRRGCIYILENLEHKPSPVYKLGISNSSPESRYATEDAWSRGWRVAFHWWMSGSDAQEIEAEYKLQHMDDRLKVKPYFRREMLFNRVKWNEIYVVNPIDAIKEKIGAKVPLSQAIPA